MREAFYMPAEIHMHRLTTGMAGDGGAPGWAAFYMS
jgi:hypothetical protein